MMAVAYVCKKTKKANLTTPKKTFQQSLIQTVLALLQYAHDVLTKKIRCALRRAAIACAQVWSSCGLVGRSIQDDILLLQPFFPFYRLPRSGGAGLGATP